MSAFHEGFSVSFRKVILWLSYISFSFFSKRRYLSSIGLLMLKLLMQELLGTAKKVLSDFEKKLESCKAMI